MNEEGRRSTEWQVPCTIWMKREDGKWLGCMALADGEMLGTGVELLKSYENAEAVEELLKKKVVESVKRPAPVDGVEFTSECGDTLMKMQAKEVGEYCYIFRREDGAWLFGASGSQLLKPLIEFISR